MNKSSINRITFNSQHTYALLLFIIVVASLLTYIIPAGEYAREKKDGQTLVISGSYQEVSQHGVSFFDIFRAIPEGLLSGGEIVFYIFLVGGAFGIVHKPGAFDSGVNKAMNVLGSYKALMIRLTLTLFLILGFSIGVAEYTIIFVPLGLILARRLDYVALTC